MYKLLPQSLPLFELFNNDDFRCFDPNSIRFKLIASFMEQLVADCLSKGITNVHAVEEQFFEKFPFLRHIPNSVENISTPLLNELSTRLDSHFALASDHIDMFGPPLPVVPVTVTIGGLGVSGSIAALMTSGTPGAEVSCSESRSESRVGLRAGSLSFKSIDFFKSLFTPDEWSHFKSTTPIGYFSSDNLYSPNAPRLPICSYEGGLRDILNTRSNVVLNFNQRLDISQIDSDVVVDSTGCASGGVDNRSYHQFSTGAATGYSLISNSPYPLGLTMESSYTDHGWEHRRVHTGHPSQFENEFRALLACRYLNSETVGQLRKSDALISFVYHMKSLASDEFDVSFKPTDLVPQFEYGVHVNAPFKVYPTISEEPVSFVGDQLMMKIGDSSGNVNFVGGFGQSKASIQMRILNDYLRHFQLLSQLTSDASADFRDTYAKDLQAFVIEAMKEVNTRYFWIAILDSIYSQQVLRKAETNSLESSDNTPMKGLSEASFIPSLATGLSARTPSNLSLAPIHMIKSTDNSWATS